MADEHVSLSVLACRAQYDPSTLTGEAVVSATLSAEPMEVGEECTFVGLSKIDAAALPVSQPCIVRESCIIEAGLPNIPRYRAINEEILRFDLGMALEDTVGGVFVDAEGAVKALWAAYATNTSDDEWYEQFEGLPIGAAISIRDALARGDDSVLNSPPPPWQQKQQQERASAAAATKDEETPQAAASAAADDDGDKALLHHLDAELRPISLSTACGINEGSGLGLTREWAEKLASTDMEKRQALLVQRLSARMKPERVAKAAAAAAALAAASGDGSGDGGGSGGGNSGGTPATASGVAVAEPASPPVADASDTSNCLHEGDLLLAVDGVTVSTFRAVEECVRRQPSAVLTLLRDGAERSITAPCPRIASDGTMHIVMWCGLVVQVRDCWSPLVLLISRETAVIAHCPSTHL